MTFENIAIRHDDPIQLGSTAFNTTIINRFFKIPSYQRSYKWEEEDFSALLKDLEKLRVDNEHQGQGRSHYMGNLFFWNDANLLNKQAFHIIDGQQRLTTCIIFLSFAFFEFQKYQDSSSESENTTGERNRTSVEGVVLNRYRELRDKFLSLILRQVHSPDGASSYSYAPRFVSDDFDLPLHRFIAHLTNNQMPVGPAVYEFKDPLAFIPEDDQDDADNFLKSLQKAGSGILRHLQKPSRDVLETGGLEVANYRLRLLALIVKIMDGLQFGLIIVNQEEEAYKVFINLNSKGKPLTQFEVFCARIDTRLKKIRQEDSRAYEFIRGRLLPEIGTALRGLKKDGVTTNASNNKREDANFEELLSYWRVLNKPYGDWFVSEPIGNLVEEVQAIDATRIRAMLEEMLEIQKLINLPNVNGIKEDDPEQQQKMCLSILDYWPMGIHLLLPFYLRPNCTGIAYTNVLKKISAFWVLYRMVQPGRNTGDIQNVYKYWPLRSSNEDAASQRIMRDIELSDLDRGLKSKLNAFAQNRLPVPADAWNLGNPGAPQLINAWAEHASTIQSSQEQVNRTLLMFAYHNTCPQVIEGNPDIGLTAAAHPTQKCRLKYSFFEAFVGSGDLEHVRPKIVSPTNPWPNFDEASLRLIGNMHLAPSTTNNFLSNAGPRTKKFYYRFWSAENEGERVKYREEMEVDGMDVEPAAALNIVVDHDIFQLVFNWHGWDPAAQVQPPIWNNLAVQTRGRALCKRAVSNLLAWLNSDY